MTRIPDDKIKLRIAWWNINKRLYLHNTTNKNLFSCVLDSDYDFVFFSETNLDYVSLPKIENYVLFSDPNVSKCSYGGTCWYIKKKLAKHVFGVEYHASFISFRLDLVPKNVFIGSYIQPEGARYFNPIMFSDLASFIQDARSNGLTPYVGGDFNSRPGNFNIHHGTNTQDIDM